MKTSLLASEKLVYSDEDIWTNILNQFRDGKVGNKCRIDLIIQHIGYRNFCLSFHDKAKEDEIRKTVMSDIKKLTRLFLEFKSLCQGEFKVESMFVRKYFPELRETINSMCETSEKHVRKLILHTIFQRSTKSSIGYYPGTMQDEECHECKKSIKVYNFRTNELVSGALN